MARKQFSRRDISEAARPPRKPVKMTPARLRIISGSARGRKIEYNGDPATRPMKERTREAVFSLLGGHLPETVAIDLFGGTGVLAMESISRGSVQATILELSRACVSSIVQNLKHLGFEDRAIVQNVDTLRWLKSLEMNAQSWPKLPWVVFCCPPYRLWETEGQRLADGLRQMYALAPSGSQFICETDLKFDLAACIPELDWDIRTYSPAYVGVCRKA